MIMTQIPLCICRLETIRATRVIQFLLRLIVLVDFHTAVGGGLDSTFEQHTIFPQVSFKQVGGCIREICQEVRLVQQKTPHYKCLPMADSASCLEWSAQEVRPGETPCTHYLRKGESFQSVKLLDRPCRDPKRSSGTLFALNRSRGQDSKRVKCPPPLSIELVT